MPPKRQLKTKAQNDEIAKKIFKENQRKFAKWLVNSISDKTGVKIVSKKK